MQAEGKILQNIQETRGKRATVTLTSNSGRFTLGSSFPSSPWPAASEDDSDLSRKNGPVPDLSDPRVTLDLPHHQQQYLRLVAKFHVGRIERKDYESKGLQVTQGWILDQ